MKENKYPSPYIIELDQLGDQEKGMLSSIEHHEGIPFDVKRTFWTYNLPKSGHRGNHAHVKTQEVVIALTGSLEVEVLLPEIKNRVFFLENPNEALYLPPNVWRTIHYTEGTTILVLASEAYDGNDYVKDMIKWLNN